MHKRLKLLLIVLAIAFLGMQFVRPARTNPMSDPATALGASVPVPAAAAAILDRSCRDCHSNETRWPWYSHVAPASWFVIDHVNHGRSHFNYSVWNTYDRQRQAELLKGSCELAREGAMPMPSYLLMHGSARLSPAEVGILCDWAAPATNHQPPTAKHQAPGTQHQAPGT